MKINRKPRGAVELKNKFFYVTSGAKKITFHEDQWSSLENGWRWSLGSESTITISFNQQPNTSLLLRFYISCLQSPITNKPQKLELYLDETLINVFYVSQANWYETKVPSQIFIKENLKISFKVSVPRSPSCISDSPDKRLLGIKLCAIQAHEQANILPLKAAIDINSISNLIFWRKSDDLLGQMFFLDGQYFRAINHTASDYFQFLYQFGILELLADEGLIPPQEFIKISDTNYFGLLTTRTGYFCPHSQFPLPLLIDACETYIRINLILLEKKLPQPMCLVDGHHANFILYDNCRPKWVDIGSIQPCSSYDGQGAINGLYSFIRHFILPLAAMRKMPNEIECIRRLMRDYHDQFEGVPNSIATELIGSEYSATALGLPEFEFHSIKNAHHLGLRKHLLEKILYFIKSINFSDISGYWSDYYFSDNMEPDWVSDICAENEDRRYNAIQEVIIESGCTTFVDFASNKGRFSLIAMKNGLSGIAVDYDEKSLSILYDFIKNHPELSLCIAKAAFPEHHHTGELVFALAISHHLVLSQGFTWSEIASHLRKITTKVLVTEFMPYGTGGIESHPEPVPNPLPEWYSLESYLGALRNEFSEVSVKNYDRPYAPSQRVLIVCRC